MKKIMSLIRLLWKRNCRQAGFWILSILTPVVLFILFTQNNLSEGTGGVPVALYAQDETGSVVIQALLEKEGTYAFYEADSVTELEEAVITGHAECGYIFSEDLFKRMSTGEQKLIRVIENPASTVTGMVEETVYTELFRQASVEQYGALLEAEADIALPDSRSALERRLQDNSTFSFQYETLENGALPVIEKKSDTMLFKGIAALMMFFCGCSGVFLAMGDDESRCFRIRYRRKRICILISFLVIFMPILWCGLEVLLCAGLAGAGNAVEAMKLVAFAILLTLWLSILKWLCQNRRRLSAAMPVLIGAMLLCSPVIIDLSDLIPGIRVVRWLFPTTWYLLW
ncbi:MAG: ABC transporter permease [Lachnospiraceae bacterium]|nr:ABC transporter permease [Lachnospiraceae bacterium]